MTLADVEADLVGETEPMATSDPDDRERLGKLEATILSIRDDVIGLRAAIIGVQTSISASRETNWSVILAAVALVGAMYAAAIRPIANDITRQETSAQALSLAVIEQNKMINDMRIAQQVSLQRISDLGLSLSDIRDNGSPVIDRRLAVLEVKR